MPVAILMAACDPDGSGGDDSEPRFDPTTGCCVYTCNACEPEYADCPEGSEHADETCDPSLRFEDRDDDGDGYDAEEGDCDDEDATVFPGSRESCDGSDDDCDGEVDEGCA